MRNIYKEEDVPDDAPPGDRVAKGTNKHRVQSCPFCGAAVGGAVAVQITAGAKPDFAVRCAACDCTGPWAITAKLAIGLWNDGYESSRPASGRRTRERDTTKKQKTKN